MKKIYSLALAAFVAASASAIGLQQAKGTITVSNTTIHNLHLTGHSDAQIASLGSSVSIQAPIATVPSLSDWEEVGNATFYEGIVLPALGATESPAITAKLEKHTNTEGMYRVSGVYKVIAEKFPSVFTYDEAAAEPIIFQVVGDNKFYMKGFNTGLILVEDGSSISVRSQAEGLINANGLDLVLSLVPGAFGDVKDGVFKYDDPTFTLNGNTYYDLLISFSGDANLYRGNTHNGFKMVMPGAVDKDTSISISNSGCADNNEFVFEISLGVDVNNYKVFIVSGDYAATTTNLGVVAQNGTPFTKEQTVLSYSPKEGTADGVMTIFGATVDDEGNLLEGTRSLFYIVNDNADQWSALEKKAKYTDDIVASIYNNHADTEREVAIEVNKEIPGYYRLVNPYAEYNYNNNHDGNHNHYIYINASNPEQVYIEESPIGFELGDGAMVVTSMAYDKLQQETDPAKITEWGKLEGNTITFPTDALLARELNYNNATWYLANSNNAFKVVLPEFSGVDMIENDNADAPVEYFNLQGVKVAQPANGLYIVRQGNKVTKQVIR